MKKKIMWIISLMPLVITSFLLQFLPEKMPMHYDLHGNVDRYGNKIEQLIFPIIIIGITIFWQLLICHYEKKTKKAASEKEVS